MQTLDRLEDAADASAERAWCAEMLPRVSRTFALSIEALPAGLSHAVCVAYLLCRTVDTIEDQADLDAVARAALFDEFDRLLADDRRHASTFERLSREHHLDADGASGELCRTLGVPLRRFRALPEAQREAIRPHVAEMSAGMREYSLRSAAPPLRIADPAALDRYCYYVAGTVGNLLTALFELEVPSLAPPARQAARERAVSFGLGLQLVNIVKDVGQDVTRGICFLPESVATAQGLDLERMLEPEHRERGLKVIRVVCQQARGHLERAREYVLVWPAREGRAIRLFCAVPLGLALATLEEVENGDSALRIGVAPKLSRGAVERIFAEAGAAVSSDAELTRLLDRCARGEYR